MWCRGEKNEEVKDHTKCPQFFDPDKLHTKEQPESPVSSAIPLNLLFSNKTAKSYKEIFKSQFVILGETSKNCLARGMLIQDTNLHTEIDRERTIMANIGDVDKIVSLIRIGLNHL